MKTKIEANYCYDGLGFPVVLKQVEMVYYQNEWHPKVDVKAVADEVIKGLALQDTRLTGNQVKFIRAYFSMPLREFGEMVVHESHSAVNKWEKKGDNFTLMNENTEQVLRLYIIEQIVSKSKKSKVLFYSYFQKSKMFIQKKQSTHEPLHISNCA